MGVSDGLCLFIYTFFSSKTSYIRCTECKLNVTKDHLKCHFGGAKGDKCGVSCDNDVDNNGVDDSYINKIHDPSTHVYTTQECSECSMVCVLIMVIKVGTL